MKTKINWLEWSQESFEKAKMEDKPILLDLTAVWCHWCHVMDMTSYSDDTISEMINNEFVPIKVDIDKRPDIRERYNMGGFPSTVFLDPDGHAIAGDTYVPPERFKAVLKAVEDAYKKRKDEIRKKVLDEDDEIKKHETAEKAEINDDVVKLVLLSIEDNFDNFYGGFGLQPKFPSPEVIDLLFAQYRKTKSKKYLDMALKTLDCMHEGLFDKTDFGFFRYSVTQDWKMPHYEKMLDTNAGLLRNYADAYSLTNDEKYREIAEKIITYVSRFLSDQNNGGFYGSQDADEEFYHAKPEERKNKGCPYVDRTIYIDWNAMMVSSYIKAGGILKNKAAGDFAIKTIDFILDRCYGKENGLFHFYNEKPKINGLLNDNIYFLNCLIDAYFLTQDKKYHEKIKEILDFILKNFYDGENYGFFDRIAKEGDFGALKRRNKHFLENSFSSVVFLRLYFLLKKEEYKEAAENTLKYFFYSYLNFSYFGAVYAAAAGMLLNEKAKYS